jgi:hypothetical protein
VEIFQNITIADRRWNRFLCVKSNQETNWWKVTKILYTYSFIDTARWFHAEFRRCFFAVFINGRKVRKKLNGCVIRVYLRAVLITFIMCNVTVTDIKFPIFFLLIVWAEPRLCLIRFEVARPMWGINKWK